MKTKYFGEFLIEKNIIGQRVLIDALINQIESLPSIPRTVLEEKLLSEEQVMLAFRYQQDNHCEFLKACEFLTFWNSELQKTLEAKLQIKRKPLGEVLIDLKKIEMRELTKALDEFLSTAEVPAIDTSAVASNATPAAVVQAIDDTDYMEFQPALLMEVEEVFDERKRKVMKTALVLIKDNSKDDPSTAIKLYQDVMKILKSISGLCLILGLEKIGNLIVAIEDKVNQRMTLSRDGNCFEDNIVENELIKDAIDLAWEFRVSLISTCSEKKFMQENSHELSLIENKLKS